MESSSISSLILKRRIRVSPHNSYGDSFNDFLHFTENVDTLGTTPKQKGPQKGSVTDQKELPITRSKMDESGGGGHPKAGQTPF